MKIVLPFIFAVSVAVLSAPPPKLPEVPADLLPQIQPQQPGVKLTLLADHLDLVTPTGIDVDAKGNIWLIACHTRMRPQGYAGPEHDEILVFDRDGKNRRVFYNKTDTTMQLKLGPDGWVSDRIDPSRTERLRGFALSIKSCSRSS